jgi:hypothetical protein
MSRRNPKRSARRAIVIFPLILLPMILVAKVIPSGPLSVIAPVAAGVLTGVLLSRWRRGLQIVDRIVAWMEDDGNEPDIFPPPGLVENLLTYIGMAGIAVCVLSPPLREGGWIVAPMALLVTAMSRQRSRENKTALTLHEEREILRDRLARGLAVASYWRDGVMQESRADLQTPYRAMAHPLACAISALTGEEHEPSQMGITDDAFASYFPVALAQLDGMIALEQAGALLSEPEHCWTSSVAGARCHRGGIGCPRPHADDPPELRRIEPRNLLAYDPLHPEHRADPFAIDGADQ